MPVAGGDLVRVTCRFKSTIAGDIVNVHHLKITGGSGTTDAQLITDVNTYINGLYSNAATALGSDTDPYDLRIDMVEMVGGVEHVVRNVITQTWTLTTNPNATGEKTPPMNAAIVNLRTALPRVFGRKYLGTIAEGVSGDGDLVAGTLTTLGTFAASLIADFTGANFNFQKGVLSAKAGSGASYWAPFVGYVVNSLLGTQRRRRKNRGS